MKRLCLVFGLMLSCPVQAADWGYEDLPPPKPKAAPPPQGASAAGMARSLVPVRTVPAPEKKAGGTGLKSGALPGASGRGAVSAGRNNGAAPTIPSVPTVDAGRQAALCWLQMFQGSSKEQLSFEYQKRIEKYMAGKAALGGKSREEVLAILKFWPKVSSQLKTKPDLEFQYADLFRALLRIRQGQNCETLSIEACPDQSDSEIISELLGPERIAVAGEPPLTEAAINAYADMACFIYEQQHAGKTIDANDNRALFAKVVAEKFKDAPTDQDRKAMANFDLVWAKFKIVWFNSNEKIRQILLQKLVKTGAGSSLTVAKEPVMEAILVNWPWDH